MCARKSPIIITPPLKLLGTSRIHKTRRFPAKEIVAPLRNLFARSSSIYFHMKWFNALNPLEILLPRGETLTYFESQPRTQFLDFYVFRMSLCKSNQKLLRNMKTLFTFQKSIHWSGFDFIFRWILVTEYSSSYFCYKKARVFQYKQFSKFHHSSSQQQSPKSAVDYIRKEFLWNTQIF